MTFTPISSRTNPWFARFRRALKEHDDEIVIEGPKQVADAVAGGWEAIAIAAESDDAAFGSATRLVFSPGLLDALADTVTPQRVLGLFRRPRPSLEELFRRPGPVVVLDGVQDPGNVGTIVRLAAAFDAAGVVATPDSADPYGPKSVRGSSGTLFLLAVVVATRESILEHCRASGRPLYAAAAGGDTGVPPDGVAIAFGSEGRGVSPQLREAATALSIAISPRVESLNVAGAAAIILQKLYELRR